jgi:hypothetical protein
MLVCCGCCVLSGRSLCDKLITRPEESQRLWCVVVCDIETSSMRRSFQALDRSSKEGGRGFSSEEWHSKFTKKGRNTSKAFPGLTTKLTLHFATKWMHVFPVIFTINRDYLAIYYKPGFVTETVCFL